MSDMLQKLKDRWVRVSNKEEKVLEEIALANNFDKVRDVVKYSFTVLYALYNAVKLGMCIQMKDGYGRTWAYSLRYPKKISLLNTKGEPTGEEKFLVGQPPTDIIPPPVKKKLSVIRGGKG